MKIQIVSDIHLGFHQDRDDKGRPCPGKKFAKAIRTPNVDVLIIAGDTLTLEELPEYGEFFDIITKQYPKIIIVSGNHEFYGQSLDSVKPFIQAITLAYPNITWLDKSSIELNGYKFVGTTLWVPYAPEYDTWHNNLSDFKYTKGIKHWLFPEHDECRRYITKEADDKTIVITHVAPHKNSISPEYIDSPINFFFACDMTPMIMLRKPKLWIHGHVHSSHDYIIDKTRIVCNPLGYIRGRTFENQAFDFHKTIDI
jgi:Icc-related predicted phosphoesterase